MLYVVYDTATEDPVQSKILPLSAIKGKSLVHCSSALICSDFALIICTTASLIHNAEKIKDIPIITANILFRNENKV